MFSKRSNAPGLPGVGWGEGAFLDLTDTLSKPYRLEREDFNYLSQKLI